MNEPLGLCVVEFQMENFGVIDDLLESLITNRQETSVVAKGIYNERRKLGIHSQQLFDIFLGILKLRLVVGKDSKNAYIDDGFRIATHRVETFGFDVFGQAVQ